MICDPNPIQSKKSLLRRVVSRRQAAETMFFPCDGEEKRRISFFYEAPSLLFVPAYALTGAMSLLCSTSSRLFVLCRRREKTKIFFLKHLHFPSYRRWFPLPAAAA